MQQEPCIPITLLLCSQARVVALEARVAELTRPKHPEDFGLHATLTPTEEDIVMVLLPPGEPIHRDVLIARAWPALEKAGMVGESAHLLRVHMSRARSAVRAAGWSIPAASQRSEYVLLRPGDPLPAGYVPGRGDVGGARYVTTPVPCPRGCGRLMHYRSKRCIACRTADEDAVRTTLVLHDACPRCTRQKRVASMLCRSCAVSERNRRRRKVAA